MDNRKYTLPLSKDLHLALKLYAAANGVSMQSVIEVVLLAFLQKEKAITSCKANNGSN